MNGSTRKSANNTLSAAFHSQCIIYSSPLDTCVGQFIDWLILSCQMCSIGHRCSCFTQQCYFYGYKDSFALYSQDAVVFAKCVYLTAVVGIYQRNTLATPWQPREHLANPFAILLTISPPSAHACARKTHILKLNRMHTTLPWSWQQLSLAFLFPFCNGRKVTLCMIHLCTTQCSFANRVCLLHAMIHPTKHGVVCLACQSLPFITAIAQRGEGMVGVVCCIIIGI